MSAELKRYGGGARKDGLRVDVKTVLLISLEGSLSITRDHNHSPAKEDAVSSHGEKYVGNQNETERQGELLQPGAAAVFEPTLAEVYQILPVRPSIRLVLRMNY